MKGRWTSVQESRDSITSSLSLSQGMSFVITLDQSSEFAREIDASALPTVDGALVLGNLGVVRDGEVGYQLHPAVWGRGVAPEVLKKFIPAYFDAFDDAEKLIAYTDSLNVRSTRVLEKLGFTSLISKPYESVQLGMRMACKWEVSRGEVKKWDVVETASQGV
jgi:RimJ/RimL family protein N-acetyltransferase